MPIRRGLSMPIVLTLLLHLAVAEVIDNEEMSEEGIMQNKVWRPKTLHGEVKRQFSALRGKKRLDRYNSGLLFGDEGSLEDANFDNPHPVDSEFDEYHEKRSDASSKRPSKRPSFSAMRGKKAEAGIELKRVFSALRGKKEGGVSFKRAFSAMRGKKRAFSAMRGKKEDQVLYKRGFSAMRGKRGEEQDRLRKESFMGDLKNVLQQKRFEAMRGSKRSMRRKRESDDQEYLEPFRIKQWQPSRFRNDMSLFFELQLRESLLHALQTALRDEATSKEESADVQTTPKRPLFVSLRGKKTSDESADDDSYYSYSLQDTGNDDLDDENVTYMVKRKPATKPPVRFIGMRGRRSTDS
ncbi:Uncharacterised protein g4359 [Pycnogonum litorale]